MAYDTSYLISPPANRDTVDTSRSDLRISGAKDFSFDVKGGFDQGLKVNIAGEVEGVAIEGNLSDKATPSSTVPISEIERISLKLFTPNFTGGLGNLTLDLPFNIQDDIRGGRIGIHTPDQSSNLSAAYAINRGVYVRSQFIGEEGKQSPYLLEPPVLVGSEQIYIAQGSSEQTLLNRERDYSIDYENGILSFTNRNIITSHTRITAEYRRAVLDYLNTYKQVDGALTLGKTTFSGLYRSTIDDRDNPLSFVLSPAEIESLSLTGDSAQVLHTYADTSSGGSYIIQADHFVYVGQGNGTHEVTFFYIGEGKGEYVYDPTIKAFLYRGANLGNYSPTKALPLPVSDDFLGLSAELFESFTVQVYGSMLDQNTYSVVDDENNNGFGYRARIEETFGFASVKGDYVKYSKDFFSPTSREDVDYQNIWNTNETLEEMGDLLLGLAATDFLKMDLGYGVLNRKHRRKFLTLRPFFFTLGYESIDDEAKYFASLLKKYRRFQFMGRFEKYGTVQILNYGTQYIVSNGVSVGLNGGYDRDTVTTGITNTLNINTPIVALSAGHRSLNDTTFLFGNATINWSRKGFAMNADLQQSQRYSQKRDEAYIKVEEGKGDYVYDPVTDTYIEKEGGNYVRKIFLLPDYTRVVARNFGIELSYTRSPYSASGRFYYVDEKDFLNHNEDILLNLNLGRHDIALNLRQNVQEDARYALGKNSNSDRVANVIPTIGPFSGRFEIQATSEKIGESERERRHNYRSEISYDILSRPILRPKVGYSYSRIYSAYFADLELRQHAPKIGMLLSMPIKSVRGKVETSADLVYRSYNVEDIPFFFSANEPAGYTTTLGALVSFGVGTNTIFNLIYRIEFRPDENPNQTLRLQSRVRF